MKEIDFALWLWM